MLKGFFSRINDTVELIVCTFTETCIFLLLALIFSLLLALGAVNTGFETAVLVIIIILVVAAIISFDYRFQSRIYQKISQHKRMGPMTPDD